MSADAAPQLITIAQWAREEGIASRVARVRIQRHQIPVVDGLIDRVQANEIWQREHNPHQANRRKKKPAADAVGPKPESDGEAGPRRGRPPSLNANVVNIEGGRRPLSFSDIELERSSVKLQQEKLKYATAAGLVYPAPDVDIFISSMIVSCRETLWHLPGELQDKLAAAQSPIECGKILQRGIEGALKKMAKFNFKPKKK